jgi:ABC-2 type transport system ATP-binding protein
MGQLSSFNISMPAIQTHNLRRVYKARNKAPEVLALDDVSIQVEDGEIWGLLGPNGAGKTTLVKILSTVLLPTGGRAVVLGHDVVKETDIVRRRIGIVFGGERGLYWHLTGRQNLEYWAALYQVSAKEASRRISRLLERVGLLEKADHLVESYSRGMKQRLHLARGLIGDARVLFLDEPTTGMDPLAALEFRRLIKELRSEGRTILLTTHDMAEAEAVCDRVALIDHGRLLAVETPRTLSRLVAKYERIDFERGGDETAQELRKIAGVAAVSPLDGNGSYRVELSDAVAAQRVLGLLLSVGITSIRTSHPTLEEVYVQLIGDRGLKI